MGNAAAAPGALISIDGQDINVATTSALVDQAIARLRSGLGFTVFTFNLDHVVKRRQNAAFSSAYKRATFVTADGAPIVWLAGRQGARIERVTGADLVLPMCEAAARTGVPVAFFGSSGASLDTAASQLRRLFPRLIVRFLEAPPLGFDPTSPEADAAAARLAASGATLCFVCLGAPKQELFADRMTTRHPSIGFLGVGAAVDFLAGEQRRAPAFFRSHGLEWAWRLLSDPRRLTLRYARCAAAFGRLALAARARSAGVAAR